MLSGRKKLFMEDKRKMIQHKEARKEEDVV